MSTTARSSQRGGTKNSKQQKSVEENHKNSDHTSKNSADKENKSHKNDAKSIKNSAGDKKGSVKALPQPTAEQLRMARITKSDHEEQAPDLQAKIKMVMDLTMKSEEAVCAALAENDEDINRAVEVLIESGDTEFEFTSVKKKKNKTLSAKESGKDKASPEEELNHVTSANGGGGYERRGRGRGRGGATSDRGGRPYRSRENKENENYRGQNSTYPGAGDEFSDRPRRGGPRMTNGPSGGPGRYGGARGGRGGGRGGGVGPRTYSARQDGFPKSIDTWNNPPGAEDTTSNTPVKMETWGEFPSPEDWDNEEYTGSLADSKVFTPSSAPEATALEDTVGDTLNGSFTSNTGEPPAAGQETSSVQANSSGDDLTSPVMSSTLTAAQSQYLSQLTQQAQGQLSQAAQNQLTQAASSQNHYVSNQSAPAYTTGTEFVNSYSTTLNDIGNTQQVLPQRNKAPRTRLPPPSKIPASAVEMPPGDTSSGTALGSIDVQFGALDFGTEPSPAAPQVSFGVDTQSDPSATGNGPSVQSLPPTATKYSSQATDPIAEHAYVSSTSLAAAASQLKNNHSLTSLGKSAGGDILNEGSYNAGRNTTFQELASMASKAVQDPYESSSFPAASQSLYQSGKTSVSSSYPPSSTPYPPSHSQASYSTSSTGYSSTGYNQMSNGSQYSNPSSQYGSSYVPSGYPGYSTPSYQQPGNTTSYGTSGQQSSGYQYNNVSGLSNSGYNSYQSSGAGGALAHKLGSSTSSALSKDSQYESIPAGGQSGTPATLNSSTPAGLSSLTQTSISSSSASSAAQKSSGSVSGVSSTNPPSSAKSSNVASIPPGVGTPVVGTQYIMSSTGLPYMYNQPPMYNFEDLQLVQNRIPHGYYDLGFPPTSMGGREGGSIPAYSAMSDARFARTDNNASPVPSSLSTQNATQAPLLNPPLPYAYYYSSIPSNPFSYSTPLYPQVNAGGYASTQPGTGGSGGGKTSGGGVANSGGVANASPQGTGGGASAGNPQADLMYSASKSQHASLAKVNSYDKATFHHTGTPPPYTLPGVGSVGVGAALGPSGTFAAPGHSAYTPVMVPGPQAPHHSTPLMHQPHLQMDLRTSQTRRTDSTGNSTSRSQAGSQVNKTSSKPYYGNWAQN